MVNRYITIYYLSYLKPEPSYRSEGTITHWIIQAIIVHHA